ncbi:uncharacterized MFS-type transporter C09D4.1-like [Bacillus rossius redtenbacheri]|uniref:uncharacterized MFS-type transporter C09D4.1-like n=1 Tax=Bacillus rossius redtenbacheri TaxID=93214 RepID=UPI002FDC7C44
MSGDYRPVGKPGDAPAAGTECRAYPRRWLVLAVFAGASAANASHWISLAIVGNVVGEHYGVTPAAVEWTSMVFMVTYVPLVLPAAGILDKWGLRRSLLLGAAGTALGAWLKVLGTARDHFWVVLAGQTVVASSQVFILSVPPRLAAVWFPAHQVSSACSVGVFGNQLGIAAGFLLPPLVVKRHDDAEATGWDLALLYYGMAGLSSLCLVLVLLFFSERPATPPSPTQLLKLSAAETPGFWGSLRRLLGNPGYVHLTLSYGLLVGVFFALSTLLNQVILFYFEDGEELAGQVGLLMILAGMLGSVVSGLVLDKTHRFKETALCVYFMSLVGMCAFTLTLDWDSRLAVFATSGLLGFFMTGYLPLGFEFAAELTYPEPETTSGALLSASTQVFGVALTSAYSWAVGGAGVLWANIGLCCALLLGLALTWAIRPDLRRLAAARPPGDKLLSA